MGAQQQRLELRLGVPPDAHELQRADPGREAVDRKVALEQALEHRARGVHPLPRAPAERDPPAAGDVADAGREQRAVPEHERRAGDSRRARHAGVSVRARPSSASVASRRSARRSAAPGG